MKAILLKRNPTWRIGFIFTALAALGTASSSHANLSFNSSADIKAISDIEMYINSQTDMKGVISYYAPDAVVYDIPTPGTYHGTKQIYDGFQPQLAALASINVSLPDFNVVTDGTMACVAMQVRDRVVFKGGVAMSFSYRDIDVFRKIGGKWKVTQAHLGLPANLKTGTAVMDGPIQLVGHLNWGKNTLSMQAISETKAKAEISKWMVAAANTVDVDNWGQFYGQPDNNLIIYDAAYPGDLRGLRQTEDYYRPNYQNFKSIKSTITESDVDSDGVLGAVIEQQTLQMNTKDGGKSFATFRQSDCLHRVNGKWYAFFELLSFPTDLKTGKSIMGGVPPQH